MKVAIIGGGAAGFFSAITAKENYPNAEIVIFEKTKTILSKVKISGGGRCNVTNGCTSIKKLTGAYPRGGKELKKAFSVFNTKHTMSWFESRDVPLVIQEDNCVFPKSQDSQSIIDCFINETKRLKIKIKLNCPVIKINPVKNKLVLTIKGSINHTVIFDKVIVTTGGSPKRQGLNWLEELGHKIKNPVPSLFTFNINSMSNLMGIVVENTIVSIQSSKIKADGALLITHWGMSGPAILKLSSLGARVLSEMDYNFNLQVNWVNIPNNEIVLQHLKSIVANNANKKISNIKPFNLPVRLWLYLLKKRVIPENKKWSELGKKGLNNLVAVLTNDIYSVTGKSKFKDEFVTCGGISLNSIDFNTMQSKNVPNLYFAGEVLDIDGITGGYNFQSAWTTGYIAGKLITTH